MRKVIIGNLAPGGAPNPILGGDVVERLLELPHAMRLPDEERMQRQAHDLAIFRALHVEAVKLRLDRNAVVVRCAVALKQGREIVDLKRVWYTDEPPAAHVHGQGLIIVEEIKGVQNP